MLGTVRIRVRNSKRGAKVQDHITDSKPLADKPEGDPDAAYDEQRQRRTDDEAFADIRLVNDLNVAIAHVTKHNSFVVLELVALLKRARDRIYDR
jgi:hypothetical protein